MTRVHAFWGSDPSGYCVRLDCSCPSDVEPGCGHDWLDRPESDTHVCLMCGEENSGPPPAERFYAWDAATLERAAEHGCLDEDVDTGDPLVCGKCGGAA